jgi:hypothetical protein
MNHNKCVGHVSHLEHMIKTIHNSVNRPWCRCEDVIKVNIKEIKCMCTGYKRLPHFIESEYSLLCPQGSLNPGHTDETYHIKFIFIPVIPFLLWFPKQINRFCFWNENGTCISSMSFVQFIRPAHILRTEIKQNLSYKIAERRVGI